MPPGSWLHFAITCGALFNLGALSSLATRGRGWRYRCLGCGGTRRLPAAWRQTQPGVYVSVGDVQCCPVTASSVFVSSRSWSTTIRYRN